MKPRSSIFSLSLVLISPFISKVQAADLFWDGTDTNANANGGNGTWDTSTSFNWDTLATAGANAQWTAPNIANFGGTAGAVSASAAISAQQLKFSTSGYVLSGSSIDLTVASSDAVVVNSGVTATINNNLTKSAGEFWVRGGGTLVVGGTNTINPSLVITEGSTLEFANISAVGGTGGLFFNGAAGTIRYTGATDATLARLSVNSSFALTNTSANVIEVASTGKLTLNDLGGGNGSSTGITKAGTGALIFAGSNAYTGATIVNAGSLVFSRATGTTYNTSVITNNASVTMSPTSLAAMFFSSRLSGSGTFNIDGPGSGGIYENRVVLKGTATASDNTGQINVINSGKLWLEGVNGVAPSTVINLNTATTVLALYGTGIRTIGGLTGTGTVSILDGGGGTPSLTIGSGDVTSSFGGVISSGSLAITKTGTGTLTLTGALSYGGSTTVSGGSLVFSRVAASTSYTTPVITNNAAVTMSPTSNAAMFFSSRLSGSGTFTIDGPGGGNIYQNRVVLVGTATASDNTGQINVINSGKLWLEGVNGVAPSTVINLNTASTVLALYGAGIRTIGGLTGTGTVTILDASGGGPPSLTIGSGNVTSSFGGVIKNDAGSLAITKTGTGSLTLSGTNSYSGATNVSAGTLVISGNQSTATGAVSVTGTLAGSGGTVGGNTTINAAGRLAPGNGTANSTGTETFTGTLTFAATSIFDWDINSPTANGATADQGTYDKVVNTNATKMSGTSVFNVILGTGKSFGDAFWDTNKTWTNVFSGTGLATDLSSIFTSFSNNGTALTAGVVTGEGQFTFSGGTTLSWVAVPEPSSVLAGLLITAGLLRRRRQH